MPRSFVTLIVIALVVVGGGLFALSSIDPTKPVSRVEKVVTVNAPAR